MFFFLIFSTLFISNLNKYFLLINPTKLVIPFQLGFSWKQVELDAPHGLVVEVVVVVREGGGQRRPVPHVPDLDLSAQQVGVR